MKRFFTVALCTWIGIICVSCRADRTEQDPGQSTARASANRIQITAGGQIFEAELYENPASAAFSEMLPAALEMQELNGNEKYYYLSKSLPAGPQKQETISAGDLMLYGTDCLVLFYESFETSYRYTPLGKIMDTTGLKEALGGGTVTVEFTPIGK